MAYDLFHFITNTKYYLYVYDTVIKSVDQNIVLYHLKNQKPLKPYYNFLKIHHLQCRILVLKLQKKKKRTKSYH